MKKILTIFLAVIMGFSLCVPAMAIDDGAATLVATGTTTSVSVSGTAADGVLAIMAELLDTDGTTSIAMQSFAVDDGAFSGDITGVTLTAGATYTVRAADYNGGSWTTRSFTVPLPTPPASGAFCTLTFVTNSGNSMNTLRFSKDSVVELTQYIPIREGYVFTAWYSDEALTNAVTSVTITENLTLYAGWNRHNPFTDVKESDYFYDAVLWAVAEKITEGTSATTFSSADSCTRAQMATFLWRAAGSPEPTSTTCPFTDVDANAYYYKAVLWAAEKGITEGTSDTTFSPNDICTRGQMATFLYRYASSPEVTGSNPFTDVLTADYYYDAVIWAAAEGVTQGTSTTTFSPKEDCTRGQIVTFLYRFITK